MGGGDARSSGDTSLTSTLFLEILARARGCCGVWSAPRIVHVTGTQKILEGLIVLQGLWDEEFGGMDRPPLLGESSALRAHGLVEGARSGQVKD